MEMKGCVAFVTGAGGGIGRAFALRLAKNRISIAASQVSFADSLCTAPDYPIDPYLS